jgi:trans-2,3-dihydro-3-hydroxyanthranilate isomerase
MQLTFHTLDVFTDRKFKGNPLAVVLGADGLRTDQMQAITREFNLSETTFVMTPQISGHTAKVRIFFPGGEMSFAGHPTLGTAALLAELAQGTAGNFESNITLELPAGLTPVTVKRVDGKLSGIFTAPVIPFHPVAQLPTKERTAQSLNLDVSDIGFDGHGLAILEGGPRFFYVPVTSRTALAKSRILEPHWSDLIKPLDGVDAVYIYTRGGDAKQTDFRARMFAPTGGIPEDPATGSATTLLAAQFLTAEKRRDGTHTYHFEQGYEMGRPSELQMQCDVSRSKLTAVRIGGCAVRVMHGVIEI